MSYILALFLAATQVLAFSAMAGEPVQANPARDEAIRQILAGFWGNARDIRGNPIEPSSQKDRETVPISRAAAYRALEAGNLSGLAEWCGLNWESHYLALTKAGRTMRMVDKQVAFFSFLHGAGQGTMVDARGSETCSPKQRAHIESLLLESVKTGLPTDSLNGW
jgi:hypothetical protein